MQQEDIVKIFPRIKDRVKFVDQLKRLIEKFKERNADIDEITGNLFESVLLFLASSFFLDISIHHGLLDSSVIGATEENQNGQTSDDIPSNIDHNENNDLSIEPRLPADYSGPSLTAKIQYYIDQNNSSKFSPHTILRGELLSLLFDDVTKTYNVL